MKKSKQSKPKNEKEIKKTKASEEVETTKKPEAKAEPKPEPKSESKPETDPNDEPLSDTPTLSSKTKPKKSKKPLIIILIIIILLGGVAAWFLFTGAFKDGKFDFSKLFGTKQDNCETDQLQCETAAEEPEPEKAKIYNRLTGLEIADASINDSPLYCIQIPNDTYGARPQVGLSKAAILFEAIAEGGITRFATVFQNLEDSVIGPIRSLRTYYLDWEIPFNCTLVHAGGEKEAAQTAANGSYRDLTESTVYMYRDSRGYKAPNNLFSSAALLTKFNSDKGYTTSNPKVFPRQTPLESETIAKTVRENAEKSKEDAQVNAENELQPVSTFKINFSRQTVTGNFNTVYKYNEKTNSYDRSYASGAEHLVYNCRGGLDKPSPKQECGEPTQLSPNVVVAIMVDEYSKDNGRENIQTIGSGDAYVFQNGSVIKATWTKSSKAEQINFTDKNGEIIKLAPGQLLIAAVPNAYGSVQY